jgi:hypothetical protein
LSNQALLIADVGKCCFVLNFPYFSDSFLLQGICISCYLCQQNTLIVAGFLTVTFPESELNNHAKALFLSGGFSAILHGVVASWVGQDGDGDENWPEF